ncbi:MAG: phosphoribosylglycinamide formyltransferase [Candidatus Eisenbacteria bacterium]|nr:phosphoribosylglycinamide formyltransferase [Candidatus Eisenbacteria bacterium]
MKKLRVGVLASGNGSNLQAIIDASLSGDIDVEVAVVISDVENARALERARKAGVPAIYIAPGPRRTRLSPEAEKEYARALEERDVEIVALAGFMRVLHDDFLCRFNGRIVNIHPSLLPSFPGLDAQRQALEYGVKWTGATVHFVDAGVDRGPIIVQAAVPVLPDDSRDTLAARVLEEEHRIYPLALQYIAEGRVRVEGRRTCIEPAEGPVFGNTDRRGPS